MKYTCTQTESGTTITTSGQYVFSIHPDKLGTMSAALATTCYERLKNWGDYSSMYGRLTIKNSSDSVTIRTNGKLVQGNTITLESSSTVAKSVFDYVATMLAQWEAEYAPLLQGLSDILIDHFADLESKLVTTRNDVRNNKMMVDKLDSRLGHKYPCRINRYGQVCDDYAETNRANFGELMQRAIVNLSQRLDELEKPKSWLMRVRGVFTCR